MAVSRGARRIGILASGGGSNLQALIDHFGGGSAAGGVARGPERGVGEIVWVGANRPDAGALGRASRAGIASAVVTDTENGDAFFAGLEAAGVELLVLAGYLKRVPAAVVRAFHGRMVNVHPALLPSFGGTGMYGRHVHEAVIAAGVTVTGVTVHWVNDEYDRGAIIAQWPVSVLEGDTPATLAARVLHVEHRLYPLCVAGVARGTIILGPDGRTHGRPGEIHHDFASLLPP